MFALVATQGTLLKEAHQHARPVFLGITKMRPVKASVHNAFQAFFIVARELLSASPVASGAIAVQPRPHATSAALASFKTCRHRANAYSARLADLQTQREKPSARCVPAATLAMPPALAALHLARHVRLGSISQVRERRRVFHAVPAFSAANVGHRSARHAKAGGIQTCFANLYAASAVQGSINLKLEKAVAIIAALANLLSTLASLCATLATREFLPIMKAQVGAQHAVLDSMHKAVGTPSASIVQSEHIQDFPTRAFAFLVPPVSTHLTRDDQCVLPAALGSLATTTVHQRFCLSATCRGPNLCFKMDFVMLPTTSTLMHAGGTEVIVAQIPATSAIMGRTGALKHLYASTQLRATTLVQLRRRTAHVRLALPGSMQTQRGNQSASIAHRVRLVANSWPFVTRTTRGCTLIKPLFLRCS